ncbi:unnamed protein product [Lactuca saligna]|uniref:Uncharacterized protein n=1 Tax=Lactuca saligna TaxID=75948 RepID=A0AA35VWE5_LACSI|nr:unnamed protein product [Lactuca saligna]
MENLPGILPSAAEYRQQEVTYTLSSLESVEFPAPMTDFQEEVFQKDGYSLQMLTPNVINKVVAFETIRRADGYLPDYFVFKFFFQFCITGDKYTFSVRRGGHTLVPDGRTPKNWQDKWLWVNQELVGSGRDEPLLEAAWQNVGVFL